MKERWRFVRGWKGYYSVSNLGRVRSRARVIMRSTGKPQTVRARMLKTPINRLGYPEVRLSRPGKTATYQVHVLVAKAFIPRKAGRDRVCHRDDVGSNNVVSNLYWGNASTNGKDAVRNGRAARMAPTGEDHYLYKITPEMVRRIHKLNGRGMRKVEIGKRVGCSKHSVYDVLKGRGRHGQEKESIRAV